MSAILGLLCTYSFYQPAVLELAQCQRPAANCVDRTVQPMHHARVTQLLPDGSVIEQLGATARVVGDNTALAMGDGIHLRGTSQADGTIRVETWHVSQQRLWQVLVCVPPAMVGAWLFWRTFRWDGGQWAFVTRNHA